MWTLKQLTRALAYLKPVMIDYIIIKNEDAQNIPHKFHDTTKKFQS